MSRATPWPEEPFSLIRAVYSQSSHSSASKIPPSPATLRAARLMALTHNTIFRALNAIYLQCPQVSPRNVRDISDLATFTLATLDFIAAHHATEESVFFPILEARAPGSMHDSRRQHEEFEAALNNLRIHAKAWLQGGSFAADDLRELILGLVIPLGRHLREEIDVILEIEAVVGDDAMRLAYEALHAEAERTTDASWTGPLVLGCQDRGFLLDGMRIQFPELPFALVPYLVDWLVSRRYSGAWRFCPSTFYGDVRSTEFFKSPMHGSSDVRREQTSSWVFVVLLSVLVPVFLILSSTGWIQMAEDIRVAAKRLLLHDSDWRME